MIEFSNQPRESTVNDGLRKKLKEASDKLAEAKTIIEEVKDEEEEKLETMPDNFKEGDKGEKMQEVIDNLEQALNGLEDVVAYVDSAAE